MKTLPALLFTIVAVSGPLRAEDGKPAPAPVTAPAPGKQTAQSVEVTGTGDARITLHYWLSLPPESEKKPEGGWPVMFFMHGAGERGANLDRVKQHGPPKLVGLTKELNKFIIVSPQWPDKTTWWDLVALKGLIDHTLKTQPVDKDRVILTGLSMGGYATWGLLAAHPDLAAAAVPICGGGDPTKAATFKDVPIRCYHGSLDNAVPQIKSDQMIEALKKAGGKPEYTIYPDAGHDSWTAAYGDAKLFQWMLEQKRPAKK
jgi:predicted peptidase